MTNKSTSNILWIDTLKTFAIMGRFLMSYNNHRLNNKDFILKIRPGPYLDTKTYNFRSLGGHQIIKIYIYQEW